MQLCTVIINRTWHRSFTHEWHESKQSAGENKVTFHRISRSLTNTAYQFACSVFSAFSFRSLPPPPPTARPTQSLSPSEATCPDWWVPCAGHRDGGGSCDMPGLPSFSLHYEDVAAVPAAPVPPAPTLDLHPPRWPWLLHSFPLLRGSNRDEFGDGIQINIM